MTIFEIAMLSFGSVFFATGCPVLGGIFFGLYGFSLGARD